MFNKTRVRCYLMVAVLCGTCSLLDLSSASGQDVGALASKQTPAADAQTTKIVDAAISFLATLSAEQKKAALFAFTDSKQRVRWSNLPDGIFSRTGVPWGDLKNEQRTALKKLLGDVLSPAGLRMVEEQMAADDVLRATDRGPGTARPGNSPPVKFGSDYYYVSFLGEPSTTKPWMLQFGGHHLAINATVVGPNVTFAPTLTGGQPVKFALNGKAIYIVEEEVDQAAKLLNSLTDQQRSKAVISTQRIDLVLGPGKDGMRLQPEGLPGSEMSSEQRAQFLKLIDARLGILNADDLAPKMAQLKAELNQTYFAWFGPEKDAGAAYWRITGPRALLEFSPQNLGGDPPNHLHNMYRDPSNEYGAAWTPLK